MMSASKDITVLVEGMTCSNCAQSLTRNLEKTGYTDFNVNFASGELRIPEAQAEVEALKKAISGAGFDYAGVKTNEKKTGLSSIEKKFFFTLPFSALLMLHMIPGIPGIGDPMVQLGLSIPVVLLGWWHFGRSAFKSLKSGVPNMDVLIFIGFSSAFFYSLYGTIVHFKTAAIHDFMFFETAASIVTLVLLGNVLEFRSVKQTTSAISDLEELQQGKATRIVDGKEEDVEIGDLTLGDLVRLHDGDAIPTDGELTEGSLKVDESMISGESDPVSKKATSGLIGGTVVSHGNGIMKVTGVGQSTVLSGIIEMVSRAQKTKPAIQRLADRISAIFVPVVLSISALTFVITFWVVDAGLQTSLMSAIAVLVISCPCAMGLATPTAVMVGLGRSAQEGILFKGADSMERLASVKTVFFDKTGTLTTGKIKVDLAEVHSSTVKEDVLKAAVGLASRSVHPISKAVVSGFSEGVIATWFSNVEELKGLGIKGEDKQGNVWMLGSRKSVDPKSAPDFGDLFLSENGEFRGSFMLQDTIRPGAKELVQFLRKRGMNTILLSGDSELKVRGVGSDLGIDQLFWEKKPEEKLALINESTARESTAMIGDGINDAPALTSATVGVSLSQGTQVAIKAADVVLLENHGLHALKRAFRMGEETVTTIRQNLFWAFAYNVVAIPIAAFGFLNPMVAAFTMAFSDVVVIGNAIRFKYRKIK